MTNPAMTAAYTRAFPKAGVTVTIQRVTGFAPNVATLASASVTAIIRKITSDTTMTAQAGSRAFEPGTVRQADRWGMVMVSDLAAQGFPVPLAVGDQIVLPDSTEILDILRVDAYERRVAGAVEFECVGAS
jgi:hypothetical protein